MLIQNIFLLLFPISTVFSSNGVNYFKSECSFFPGRSNIKYCRLFEGAKYYWRHNSIAWNPEQTKNMSLVELRKHCDDYFVCMENTGCYMDFVNYQELDKCIDDVFHLGPMYYCEKTLKEVIEKTPDQVSECVKDYLKNKNPDKVDCVSIQTKSKCFLEDVGKHCGSDFLSLYKQHINIRLYNRACDGRLRYKDRVRGDDNSMQRGIITKEDVERDFGSNSTQISA